METGDGGRRAGAVLDMAGVELKGVGVGSDCPEGAGGVPDGTRVGEE